MRDDIIVRDENGDIEYDECGNIVVDFSKAIGTNYGRGFFTNCNARYRVYEGGRSTKKSYNMIGYESVIKIVSCPLRNIVVFRQNDVDNSQTTFTQILSAIEDLGMSEYFEATKKPYIIKYVPTGQLILFRGMNNPTSVNGIKFKHGYWTDSYFEEAYELESYEDFRKVDGSMRGKLPPGYFFQLTMCMNAWSQDTWIYDRFFKGRLEDDYEKLDDPKTKYMDYYDPNFRLYGSGLYLHKSTYKCNEFRDPDYDLSAMEMKKNAPEIYKVEFLGMWGNATESVYPEFNDRLVKPIQELLDEEYHSFAIGIDTGYSDGQGKRITVKKNEKASEKVKAATTMVLACVTRDLERACFVDEYFHSNNKSDNETNTDNRDNMTQPEIVKTLIATIAEWKRKYEFMKGTVRVFVDSADIGTRQSLDVEARRQGLFNVEFYASTKFSIQTRVDFSRLLMAYGDYLVCDQCKNIIRETKMARRGEKGEARQPGNDHTLDASDYAITPQLTDLRRWKTFKQR